MPQTVPLHIDPLAGKRKVIEPSKVDMAGDGDKASNGEITFGEINQIDIQEAIKLAGVSTKGQYVGILRSILEKINKGGQAFSVPGIRIDGKPIDATSSKALVNYIRVKLKSFNTQFTCVWSPISDCLVVLPKDTKR